MDVQAQIVVWFVSLVALFLVYLSCVSRFTLPCITICFGANWVPAERRDAYTHPCATYFNHPALAIQIRVESMCALKLLITPRAPSVKPRVVLATERRPMTTENTHSRRICE